MLDGADHDETEIDAALKAKIALEAVREIASVADLAQRYEVQGARDREAACQDRATDCRARFFSQEVRKMSVPDRRALLDRDHRVLSMRRPASSSG
jgi:transposase